MMNIIKKILLVGIVYICFLGCEKQDIVLKNRYLLHCFLIEGESPKISVQRPLETYPEYPFDVIYYDQSPVVDKINLKKGSSSYNQFEFELIDDLKLEDINSSFGNFPVANYSVGYYINDNVEIFPGEIFDISIDLADPMATGTKIEETLKANTTIPERVNINIVQTDSVFENWMGNVDTALLYNITFEDPVETNDYYYFLLYRILPGDTKIEDVNIDSLWLYYDYNTRESSPSAPQLIIDPPYDYDPSAKDGDDILYLKGPLFSDVKFNGEQKLFQIWFDNNASGYLYVELYHLSEEFYNYYYAMIKQNEHQRDIYTEPVQVYSNIENGLGIFAGASVSKKMIKIESKPN